MKALTDYIHGKGLKAGIYISPGPLTCAGFTGSFRYEAQDARRFADWGFDFLKYDWCSYGHIAEGGDPNATNIPTWGKGAPNLEAHLYPYRLMGRLLREQQRDLVYNLCQYGMANVWEWGEQVEGHCWRTAGDLGFELDRIFEVGADKRSTGLVSPEQWTIRFTCRRLGGGTLAGAAAKPCPITTNEQFAT